LTAVAVGTSYNTTATTETMTNGSFGAATLTGGVNASTLVGADGYDFEATALTPLTKVMAIEIRCTAGSLHVGSSGNITSFNTAVNGVFHWHDPAGSTELISPDLVLTAITADTSFEVAILGTTI
jgi:hypothetical protein